MYALISIMAGKLVAPLGTMGDGGILLVSHTVAPTLAQSLHEIAWLGKE